MILRITRDTHHCQSSPPDTPSSPKINAPGFFENEHKQQDSTTVMERVEIQNSNETIV